MTLYPYEIRLPLAPYRFVWKNEAAVDAQKRQTPLFSEERYEHHDGTVVVVREYRTDGSLHIMSDRGEIELIDNANDPKAPDPISVVRLPLCAKERTCETSISDLEWEGGGFHLRTGAKRRTAIMGRRPG